MILHNWAPFNDVYVGECYFDSALPNGTRVMTPYVGKQEGLKLKCAGNEIWYLGSPGDINKFNTPPKYNTWVKFKAFIQAIIYKLTYKYEIEK